jgi:hypothetical protein
LASIPQIIPYFISFSIKFSFINNFIWTLTQKGRKANWIGHILHRNCALKHFIERKVEERIEVTETQGRRRKQLSSDLKKKKGY